MGREFARKPLGASAAENNSLNQDLCSDLLMQETIGPGVHSVKKVQRLRCHDPRPQAVTAHADDGDSDATTTQRASFRAGPLLYPDEEVVRPTRFELVTSCSGGKRSIQLSYGRISLIVPHARRAPVILVELCNEDPFSGLL